MPSGSKELWQAAVYLTGVLVLGLLFLISVPLNNYIDDGAKGHACAAIGLISLAFNYRFAINNGDAIRRKGSGVSRFAAHIMIFSMISAGLVGIFLPNV